MLAGVHGNADVQVLSTLRCAGCDQIRQFIADVLSESPGLFWEEIDPMEYPEVAGECSIKSVPAVVIGGELDLAKIPNRDALGESVWTHAERSDP